MFSTHNHPTGSGRLVQGRAARLIAAVALASAAPLLAACGGDDNTTATTSKTASHAGITEFVGVVDGVGPAKDNDSGDYFVAVALKGDDHVEAYLCDATGNAHAYVGVLKAGRADLTSAQGAGALAGRSTLHVSISGNTITGTVGTPDGDVRFTASKARGIGGLYTFTKNDDGTLTAHSVRGNSVSARHRPGGLAVGTITVTGHGTQPFKSDLQPRSAAQAAKAAVARRYRDSRVIMLDSGIGKGNTKSGSATTSSGSGGNYTCCWWTF